MVAATQYPATDEQIRLAELHGLGLLDTPAEERFDQYTRLVADIFCVPTALITLVDKNRQWFKSRVGLDLCSTTRESSFCSRALSQDFLEISDARADARFAANPLVTGDPYIRFYAGAVLYGPTQQPLGTLCIIDKHPRTLSETERLNLAAFARIVEREINQHEHFKTLTHDLQRRALYDTVTECPGASLFEDHLARTLQEAADQEPVAIVHLHVTNYESLQMTLDRANRDHVMHTIAQRLRDNMRPMDQIGQVATARFALAIPGDVDHEYLSSRVRSLIGQASRSLEINGANRPIHISAGISRYAEDGDTAGELMDRARAAANDQPSGSFDIQFYSREGHALASRRHDQTHRLAQTLMSDGLTQVYQPIIDTATTRLVGVEALARWHDAAYGTVSPAEFVPIAESDTALRRALTRCSLDQACSQIAAWDRDGFSVPSISVNAPGGELYCPDFTALVREVLDHHGVAPNRLILEVTELSLITDIDGAVAAMASLREYGVRFAIDDFGTGYSSLRYLQALPLDILKIDRSFVQRITNDRVTYDLIEGILQIARSLKLAVVGEGVETEAQRRILAQKQFEYLQGYLFGHPVGHAELADAWRDRLCTAPVPG